MPTFNKKAEQAAPAQDVGDDFLIDTSSYEGTPSTRIKTFAVQHYNPYNGNAKLLRQGGYGIPFRQATDPSTLFKIGDKMTMTPLKGDPYEVFGSTKLKNIVVIGSTRPYNQVDESIVVERGRRVALPPYQWVQGRGGEFNKSYTQSVKTLYFIFLDDPSRKVYTLTGTSTKTQHVQAIDNILAEMADDYQSWVAQRKGVKKSEVTLPGKFIFKVTLGVPEDAIAVSSKTGGQTSYIAPPVLDWEANGGNRPTNLAEMRPYLVSQAEYNEIAEIARQLDEFLADPENNPSTPGLLSEEFCAAVGVTQDPQTLKVFSGNALPPARTSAAPRIGGGTKAPQLPKGNELPNETFSDWLGKPGNTPAKLNEMLEAHGVSEKQIKSAFEVESLTELESTVAATVNIFKDMA